MRGTAARVAVVAELLDLVDDLRAAALADGDHEAEQVADEMLAMVAPVVVAVAFVSHLGRGVHLPDAARVADVLAARFRSRRVAARVVADVLAELEAA
jgi:hypothetical protein